MTIDYTNIHKRLKVFNGQLFDNILKNHAKDTVEMHDRFMKSNFKRLFKKAANDSDVSLIELEAFERGYQKNLRALILKDLTETVDNSNVREKFEVELDSL